MKKELFGRAKDKDVFLYTISGDDVEVKLTNYGAIIAAFKVAGIDAVGGFDNLDDYLLDRSSQGATVGRVANRIADATLTIDGAVHMLSANQNGNCLHGGFEGFNCKVWEIVDEGHNSVTMAYYSEDGEEGFPGGVYTKVRFTLDGNALIIDYEATPEAKTAIALTNHAFFNLNGFGDTILDQKVIIYAKSISAVNDKKIPTGEHPLVAGGEFDFTYLRAIGDAGIDYDHNYVLTPEEYREFSGKSIGLAATAYGDKLMLNVYTDQPGLQFYTGNYLGNGPKFRGGITPIKHGSFCLEAQIEPNAVQHGVGIYDAGETYRQTTVYEIKKI